MKKAGVPPTGKNASGKDSYTVPSLVDPNTGFKAGDSQLIAEYLEKQYPGDIPLFPAGTNALQARSIFFVLYIYCAHF